MTPTLPFGRGRNRGADGPSGDEAIPVDLTDRGSEFLVAADLPGIDEQDADVGVRGSRLSITTHRGRPDGAVLRGECDRGTVERVPDLPTAVDEPHVGTVYEDGVLSVALSKRRDG
jgi:HSP20 family protein